MDTPARMQKYIAKILNMQKIRDDAARKPAISQNLLQKRNALKAAQAGHVRIRSILVQMNAVRVGGH